MLTRTQFDIASRAFARRHPRWQWVEHERTGYGHLSSMTVCRWKPTPRDDDLETNDDLEPNDPSTAPTNQGLLTVQQYVVYSASFNVPAFYFTIHDSTGTPLSLAELVRSSFFKVSVPDDSEWTPFAVTPPSSGFPLLSQGEHPTLGIVCWYLHPCATDKAVSEFMDELGDAQWSEEQKYTRWLGIWLMIVGGVLAVDG